MSFRISLSGMNSASADLNITSNNIANSNTTGFKVEDLMVRTEQAKPAKTLDGSAPVKFVMDTGVARNFSQGPMTKTGGDYDLAINGMGFFKVQAGGGERYTRDGRFTTNPEGVLVTQACAPVLDDGGGQITIDPRLGPVTIGKDGIVSQGAIRVGRIALVRPDDLSTFAKDGDNLYRNTTNTAPQPVTDAQIHQGMLESSNVQPVIEITKLIEIQRAYESVAKMMDNTSELSRSAVERLGKVN